MSSTSIIHIVKKGESLATLAEKYSIGNREALRSYHNRHCKKEDILEREGLLRPLQEFYIPLPSYRKLRGEGDIFEKRLSFNGGLINNQYNVTIEEYKIENGKEKERNTVNFTASLKWQKHVEGYKNIISYTRSAYLVNDKKPGLKVYTLALEAAEALYPAGLIISAGGRVEGIHNAKEIRLHWQKNYERLQGLYEDELSLKYLEEMNLAINDERLLYRIFCRDVFLQHYFAPVYQQYSIGSAKAITQLQHQLIDFKVDLTIDTNERYYLLRQEGISIDKRTEDEIMANVHTPVYLDDGEKVFGGPPIQSSVSGTYQLNKMAQTMHNIRQEIRTNLYGATEVTNIQIQQL